MQSLFARGPSRTSDPPFHGWNDKMATGGDNRSSSDVIGVLFGVRELDGCRAVKTLFGSVRYQHASVPVVDGDMTDCAGPSCCSELGAAKLSLPIAAAIPTEECYFATRPIASGRRECFATCFASRIIAKQCRTIGSNGDRRHPLATRSENGRRHLCRPDPTDRSDSHRGCRVKSLTSAT